MTEKTVRVRIAVAVRQDGTYNAGGWCGPDDTPSDDELAADVAEFAPPSIHIHFVTAGIPLPVAQEIEGRVDAQ